MGRIYPTSPNLAALARRALHRGLRRQTMMSARGSFNPDGSFAQSIDIAVGAELAGTPDVTALADGGFAVSWARIRPQVSISNERPQFRRKRPACGTSRRRQCEYRVLMFDRGSGRRRVRGRLAGMGPEICEVRFRRFDANGNALDGTDTEGMLIDDFGKHYTIQVAGLPDGGFVVAYQDDGWPAQRRRHHGASLQRGRNGAQFTVAGQLRPRREPAVRSKADRHARRSFRRGLGFRYRSKVSSL